MKINGPKEKRNRARLTEKFLVTFRKFRGLKIYKVFKALIIIAVIGFVLFTVYSLNIFFVQNVEVTALDEKDFTYISSDQIERQLLDYVGQRIFLVNIADVQNKVLESNSFVKAAYASKHMPDTISIRLIERTPALVINMASGGSFILDVEGVVLASCEDYATLCTNLPSISISNINLELKVMDKPYISGLTQILDIQSHFREFERETTKFSIPELYVIVVEFKDSTRAIFSTEKDIQSQLQIYEDTRKTLEDQAREYKEIDLRYDRPYVRVDKYTEWVTE